MLSATRRVGPRKLTVTPQSRHSGYHQQYLQKAGQEATTGSLKPIQCYGNRGPIKKMDKPGIRAILKGEL